MTDEVLTGGRMHLARSRGALSGIALIVLGAWGGLAPFIGPYFDFAFTPQPGTAWHWTAARGWFEVLPGGVALVGGLLLLLSANRAMTSFGAWIAILAGGWFVVGPQVAPLMTLGTLGSPADGGQREQVAIYLAFFTALGAVIVLFAALAAGRLSVHSVRDARIAARRDAAEREAEREQLRTEREAEPEPRPSERAVPQESDRADDAAPLAAAASPAVRPDDEPADAESAQSATPVGAATPAETHADEGAERTAAVEPTAAPERPDEAEPGKAEEPARAESADAEAAPDVATSQHPDAPYAPDGHTPEDAEVPADASPQPGGPGYETPRRYVRPSDQIPVEQMKRDHPTE